MPIELASELGHAEIVALLEPYTEDADDGDADA
jgi:hypothetical protein